MPQRKKKYRDHQDFVQRRKYNNYDYTEKESNSRVNQIPRDILPKVENKDNKPEVNSRKAAYYEKAHRYDLMAYSQLLCSKFSKEEAKDALKYFYTDVIDVIHQNDPQFYTKKIQTNNYYGNYHNRNYEDD